MYTIEKEVWLKIRYDWKYNTNENHMWLTQVVSDYQMRWQVRCDWGMDAFELKKFGWKKDTVENKIYN